MDLQLTNFIEHYYCTIIASMSLLLFMHLNSLISKKLINIFTNAIISIFVVIITETIDRILSMMNEPTFLRSFMTALGYISRVGIVYFILQIPIRNFSPKLKIANLMLFCLNAVLNIISLFVNIIFSFNEYNEFIRGPLGVLPFVISSLYLIELIIISYFKFKRGETKEGIICAFVVSFCIIAVILETGYSMIGLLPNTAIVSIVFYYTSFVVNSYSKDQLTDAFLRSKFYEDITNIKRTTYIISFDLNGLKKINDTLGHLEGDKLIENFSLMVYSVIKSNSRFYRMGGDEFVILCRTDDLKVVNKIIDDIKHKSENLNVSFSVGYSSCNNKDDFHKAFHDADQMMYKDKTEYYKNNN